MLVAKNYIDGSFHSYTHARNRFLSTNPAHTKQVLGTVECADVYDVHIAVEAAQRAFPGWRSMGMVRRAEYLWRAAKLLEEKKNALARLITREAGKQKNEALADVVEALHMAQYAFSVGHIGHKGRVLADEISEKECAEYIEPRGVVAAITPWNFPVAIPFWLVGLSLVYGNTVILKPSEETPLCGYELARLFHEAGIPRGVFQVLQGHDTVGKMLVAHGRVRVVLFTGSYDVGASIKKTIAEDPYKFCTIETGGKNAVIVLDDANLDCAVAASLPSAFKTAGQRCVSAGRIIVSEKVRKEFTKRFLEAARRVVVGNPMRDDVFYGPMINDDAVRKGRSFNEGARKRFRVLLDRNDEPPPTKDGHWLRPFVYELLNWDRQRHWTVTDEAFSPHTAIISCKDADEAIEIYNDTDYGLAASVITENYRLARHMREKLECGIFYHNLPCIGAGVRMAFGGVKKSGNLIPSAAGIVPAITHLKATTANYDTAITMAQGLSIKV